MSFPDGIELKRLLRAAGFEIYRATTTQVLLAERVRDNLIMESGVSALTLTAEGDLAVLVTLRAQASHFPGADAAHVALHAREMASRFLDNGYRETESRTAPVSDPSDPTHALDTSFEIMLRRDVPDLPALFAELAEALTRRRFTGD
jgi:hypothetical protein